MSSSTSALKRAGAGALAALTSPEAVKAEKSLAVLVTVRVVTQVGGGGAAVYLLAKLLGA